MEPPCPPETVCRWYASWEATPVSTVYHGSELVVLFVCIAAVLVVGIIGLTLAELVRWRKP